MCFWWVSPLQKPHGQRVSLSWGVPVVVQKRFVHRSFSSEMQGGLLFSIRGMWGFIVFFFPCLREPEHINMVSFGSN